MTNSSASPEWARNVVGYQCFVDSFAMGTKSAAEKSELYPQEVYNHSVKFLDWLNEFPEYSYGYAFYGGDLKGVANSIQNYLADFGINLLYLTPIFEAESNHKYDTVDYKTIDPQFGDLAVFHELVQICHANNIKLILDGVFNHTSYHHDWYLKALEGISPFNDYYKKNKDGHFLVWNGIETLPLLNHENSEVQDYLYNSPDSVVKYWLEKGADGWRLDVAERLGKTVINRIKNSMNSDFTEKMLYGEVIETYGKKWLGEHLLDGVMNYVFLGNTVNFLTNKINGETFLYELNKMYEEYPQTQLYNSWNIISSHDTNRMIFEVDGNENLFKMAVTLQFTYPGVPMIYNGDELGILPGQKDRNNRQGLDWQRVDILKLKAREPWKTVQPMDWNRVNQYSSFHFFYKHLIWLRKNHPVFVGGEFLPAYHDDDIIAYFRILGEKCALIVVNRGATKEVSISVPTNLRNKNLVLRGVHGPVQEIRLHDKMLRLTANCENSHILVN